MRKNPQLPHVNCSRGAPMGRANWLTKEDDHTVSSMPTEDRSIRLFKVNIDSGGYDEGGAYWGHGEPLWCATDDEDYREFVRARYRCLAQLKMGARPDGIPNRRLKVRTKEVPGYVIRKKHASQSYVVCDYFLDSKVIDTLPDFDQAVLYAAKLLQNRNIY